MIYLDQRLKEYPSAIERTLRILIGATGGSLGCVIVFYTTSRVLDWNVFPQRLFIPMLLVDLVSAAVLTLIIGAFTSLREKVERSARIIHNQELREHVLAEETARARANALQSEINPHFLFNTLNTLSALIEVDSISARAMIERLAEMYRYTFSCSNRPLVSLADELVLVQNYLWLEKTRFRERLHVEIKTTGDLGEVQAPCLILQPIVENAIKHGVARRRSGGKVVVEVSSEKGLCRASVLNQFEVDEGLPDLSPQNTFRNGHALENVRQRLSLLYGYEHEFKIEMEGDEWVRVSLVFPSSPRLAE